MKGSEALESGKIWVVVHEVLDDLSQVLLERVDLGSGHLWKVVVVVAHLSPVVVRTVLLQGVGLVSTPCLELEVVTILFRRMGLVVVPS